MLTIDIAAIHPRMGSPELPWPARASAQAAGWDCVAAIDDLIEMWPGRLVKVPLGFALGLPEGWEAQMRPRSGLASEGIIMPNSPGTVDADYRGEVSALLYYLPMSDKPSPKHPVTIDASPIYIRPGFRICQMVIATVPDVSWKHVARAELSKTERGDGGFGSTG